MADHRKNSTLFTTPTDCGYRHPSGDFRGVGTTHIPAIGNANFAYMDGHVDQMSFKFFRNRTAANPGSNSYYATMYTGWNGK